MKKFQKLVALTSVMALLASPLSSQEFYYDDSAYTDSSYASYMTALIPITALVIAGIIIAATNHHHHGSSSSSSSSSYHSHSGSSSDYSSSSCSY